MPFARNPAEDFNGLAGTGNPAGRDMIERRNHTVLMGASQEDGGRIYAYDMETKQRVASLDFDTALTESGNHSPESL